VPDDITLDWSKTDDENMVIESHGIDEYDQEYIKLANKDVHEGDKYTKETSVPDWVFDW